MAVNRHFPAIIDAIVEQDVDVLADGMLLVLVADSYVFDPADVFLSSIAGGDRVGSAASVNGTRTITSGVLSTDDPDVTVPTVTGDPVAGWLYVMDGASDAARRLVAHVAKGGDTTPILLTPDGGGIAVSTGSVLVNFGGS